MKRDITVIVVTPNLARLPSLCAWLDADAVPWLEARNPHELELALRCAGAAHLVVYDVTGDYQAHAETAERLAQRFAEPFVLTSADPVPAAVWSDAICCGIEDIMVEPYTVDEARIVFDRASRPQLANYRPEALAAAV